ncbi:MAG TPA: hypothetical protein VM286_00550 [Candidatus Thermoplasmatota archaeon]|nr:hypothetical protein [Candidatus Thermoplasmatota archaeon]
MRARTSATLAALLLALPVLAPAAAAARDDPMEPVRVALAALPGAVRLAIREAEDHLLTDVSQRRLQDVRDYVAGFRDLPEGEGGLRDPEVRKAYAWTEDVAEVFLAIPSQFTDAETAGAFCRAYTEGSSRAEAEHMVRAGLHALASLRALHAEAERLVAETPALVNGTPVREALGTLLAWQEGEGAQVEVCLLELAAILAIPAAASRVFDAFVVPPLIHPGGRIRVFGHSTLGTVQVQAPALGLQATPSLARDAFSVSATVPRNTGLGTQAIAVRSGGQRIDLQLDVQRAMVHLSLQAPPRVALHAEFVVRVQATSLAGSTEVDRALVSISWEGLDQAIHLREGSAQVTLTASSLGRQPLAAGYPGTDVLLPARAQATIDVVPRLPPDPTSPSGGGPGALARLFGSVFAPGTGHQLLDQFGLLILVLVLLILVALALLTAVILMQRRAARDAAWRRPTLARPTTFPSDSIVRGFAFLFEVLRRRGLVPPGRTVREWLPTAEAPDGLAQQFDEVRYGGRPETAEERKPALSWARAAWRRWRR